MSVAIDTITFHGLLTFNVRRDRPMSEARLHETAKQVAKDYPAVTGHHLRVSAHNAAVVFAVTGEADDIDEAQIVLRDYARLIYGRYEWFFSSFTSSGTCDEVVA